MRCPALLPPLIIGTLGLVTSLAVAMPKPQPGKPAFMLAAPGRALVVFAQMATIDPDVRLIGFSLGNTGIHLVYSREDLPDRLAGTGAIWVMGGEGPGCAAKTGRN